MGVTGYDPQKTIEKILFYRDQCLEWAALDHVPDQLRSTAESQAALGDEIAANVSRDIVLMADSRALIAAADNLLER